MDGDKRRASKRRSLAAGRQILARYRATQGRMDSTQTTDTSDVEEFFGHNDTVDTQTSSVREDSSFKDTTQSSISISEGETDIENMADRVSELKELLQGKEAVIESLSAEIDHMRAEACSPQSTQSQNSTQYRDILTSYQHKLQDFEQAVAQRDNLITELTSSLEKALASRDALKEQIQFINSLPILNQSNPDNSSFQNSTQILEDTIKQLNLKLQSLDVEKNEEIKSYKTKINELNQKIEFLEKESITSVEESKKIKEACDVQVEKIKKDMEKILDSFATETKLNAEGAQQEIQKMSRKHEDELKNVKQCYDDRYIAVQDRYSKELSEIETKHAQELNIFHSQLSSCKKTIDTLKNQVASFTETEKSETVLKNQLMNANHEREMLMEQIKLHKIQVEELTVKCVVSTSVLESKESIEKSLEEALTSVAQLKQENEILKLQYDDLSARYSAAQALIENNQMHERSMSSRIFELEKSLGRVSGINNSIFSEFNETTYQTFDDMALQVQLSKHKLEEKEELEKELIEKIRNLEMNVVQTSRELEEANLEKRSYEKQLKDHKNNCDKMLNDVQFSEAEKVKVLEKELKDLKVSLKKREAEVAEKNIRLAEVVERTNQLQNDCKQLMGGLQTAWTQCVEREQKINESLTNNGTRLGESFCASFTQDLVDGLCGDEGLNCTKGEAMASTLVGGINSAFNRYEALFAECERLTDENQRLKHDVESLKLSCEETNKEKRVLAKEIEDLKEKYGEEIRGMQRQHLDEIETLKKLFGDNGFDKFRENIEEKHAKEMEELRTYFEEKVLHVEKQYSEEIFSQSKKLSDDSSEVEDITDDLYFGGGGDAEKIRGIGGDNRNESKNDKRRNSKDTDKNSHKSDRQIKTVEQHCQTDLEPMDNGELCELRAAYNLQLEEQVALARRDIVNALQEQIQALLSVEDDSEENWPSELLDLRNKFTSNSKKEIEKLKSTHRQEIAKFKEDYAKAVENYETELRRVSQERGLDLNISTTDELINIKYESLFKMCIVLKGLLVNLIKYIVTCEEELNNTFITEIIKRRVAIDEQNGSIEADNQKRDKEKEVAEIPKKIIKRVHFALKSREISNFINSDSDSLLDLVKDEHNIAEKLKEELNHCLARLKRESAEVIQAYGTPGDNTIETLSKQILWTTKDNEEINAKLMETEGIIEDYQIESQQLKMKIVDLQQKISILEGAKEIISEGYGEHDDTGNNVAVQDFSQLLEKARLATVNTNPDPAHHLQLIEELCRCTEKILDDSKREKEDLQQQIDAADKQLKSTRKFLEEQAGEREIERDEAAKEIKLLQEQLKERERDKERDLRISSESPSHPPDSSLSTSKLQLDNKENVEALEFQMREMTSQISDTKAKKCQTESDLKAAVEKIWILRDIIMDLEQQAQAKSNQEQALLSQITNLKEVISAQTRTQQELAEELDQLKNEGENPMNAHISHLQSELQKHKLSNEQFNVNSTALKQMKSELREMQNHLDKRIKELEALHMCGSTLSLSQPSEDVSIRDQIEASRCETPDEDSPPTLPLDQLLKLKEKLLKHSRTEEVAFKKIKDLEMQLSTLKMQNEELQEERDILQASTSDYLLEIEKIKGRLEQYRQSAPFAQRQATSRLELELHDMNTKVKTLEQKLTDKELELGEMQEQVERATLLLKEKQDELESALCEEDSLIRELREKLELLEHEKKILESKVTQQERQQQEIPVLIESMLADKNEEIDHLKDQLSKKEKQLEVVNSPNAEEPKQFEPKNSARTLSDIVSIHSECEEMPEAIRHASNVNFVQNVSSFRREDQELQKSDLLVPPLELGSSVNTTPVHNRHVTMNIDSMMSGLDLNSPKNSSESTKESPQISQKTIQDLEIKLREVCEEVKAKSAILSKRETELNDLKKSLEDFRTESKDSIENLTRDKDFYKNQYELTQESEKKIKRDLEEMENYLKIKSEEVDVYKEKIQLNEKILMELNNENTKLKHEIAKLMETNCSFEQKLLEKIDELNNLKQIIFEKDITIETLKTRNMEIEDENKQLYDFKTKFEMLRKDMVDNQNEIKRLSGGINSRDVVIHRLEDMAKRSSISSFEDVNKDQEIHHLKDLVKEKEKIIQQMTDDSKSLHRELETVHRKMREPGNVVELRKKLHQQKKFNVELTKMVTKLSKELDLFKEDESCNPEANDLEDLVQRELNLSADLDRKIMDVIESESEEISMRKIEMHSCNSLTIKPVEQDLEKIMEQYLYIRNKLKKQVKLNEELTHQKDELDIESEMLRSQIFEYENRILQLKADYENECKRNSTMSDDLSSKKSAIRNLEVQIRKEKTAHQNSQLEDSNMIEMLRIKLTSALNTEQQLRDNNINLREKNKLLTTQLTALRFQIESQRAGVLPTSPRAISPPENPEISPEKFDKTQRENQDLRSTLLSIESERNRYKKDLEIALEENEMLLSNLAMAEGDKEHLEITQKRLKETIRAREEEIEWLQRKIKVMTDADDKRQQQKADDEHELKSLRQEIKNVREVMNDWQIDTDQMSQQLRASLAERAQLTQVVVTLRKTEEDLNSQLSSAKAEEERLKDAIEHLKEQLNVERSLSEGRVARDGMDGQFVQSISELCGKLERYGHEKSILVEKLAKERQEKEKYIARIRELEVVNVQKNFPDYTELSNKLQHLYGKYIRVDSKRKGLAFQKRYLLCVIGGYQLSEENTLSVLAQLTNAERSYAHYEHKRARVRLRSVVFVIISTLRMKWLVARWRNGVRKAAANVVIDPPERNFMGIQRGLEHSPPVREKRAHNGRGVNYEHFLERISNIQETLGLAMAQPDKRD